MCGNVLIAAPGDDDNDDDDDDDGDDGDDDDMIMQEGREIIMAWCLFAVILSTYKMTLVKLNNFRIYFIYTVHKI